MKTKERIFYYDFLRAFAIIAVIICHVDIFYGSLSTPLQIIAKLTFHDIGRIGVPIFLMISGALLLNREYVLSDFLKRRFTRIIYPFVFWMFLISIGLICFNSSFDFILGVITGDFSVAWYFWTLIGIYLSIPIINSFVRDYGEKGLEYFLVIWIVIVFLQMIHHYPLFANFRLDFFVGCMGYLILGYYLINKDFKLDDKKLLILSLILLIISLGIYVFCDYNKIDLINSIYLNIPMILIASSFILIVKSIDRLTSFKRIKSNIIGDSIVSVSKHSYGMYFSHVIVLKVLSMVNPHSNLLFPIMVILMVVLSWLLVYIVNRIPFLRKFSGV